MRITVKNSGDVSMLWSLFDGLQAKRLSIEMQGCNVQRYSHIVPVQQITEDESGGA
jgi:hypothetical protein